MLYTDGLIERRGEPLSDGMSELLRVVSGAGSAEEACAQAMASLVPPEGLEDDLAVVAVENVAAPDELRLELPATPRSYRGSDISFADGCRQRAPMRSR